MQYHFVKLFTLLYIQKIYIICIRVLDFILIFFFIQFTWCVCNLPIVKMYLFVDYDGWKKRVYSENQVWIVVVAFIHKFALSGFTTILFRPENDIKKFFISFCICIYIIKYLILFFILFYFSFTEILNFHFVLHFVCCVNLILIALCCILASYLLHFHQKSFVYFVKNGCSISKHQFRVIISYH